MNVFKDLVDELKEENLLESTVVDSNDLDSWEPADDTANIVTGSFDSDNGSDKPVPLTLDDSPSEVVEIEEPALPIDTDSVAKPTNGREFYTKRAIGEMSNLQMVEHVLTGVEREYMRIVPKVFDDFAAKKALNAFLQVTEVENSSKHSEAELAMMKETEAWCTALAERDKAVPVASIRHYCENSRPALSSQALVALARFYRNLPYSETVRSKFDFIITRLFSRPAAGNQRICLFKREEMLSHISLLYKEWSSVPLYTADEDESKVLLTALSFEELAMEAENASNFDLLVANDFFGRLGMFKESVSELFFAPNVTAAAIDCNVRVGNAYVSLIDKERAKMDSQTMYEKFGSIDNLTVSDAAARTLEIVDILKKQREYLETDPSKTLRNERNATVADRTPTKNDDGNHEKRQGLIGILIDNKVVSSISAVNKWLLATSVLVIVISVSIFAWAEFSGQPTAPDKSVRSIELNNPVLRKHLKTARVSNTTFYGLLLPSWDTLPKDKREEYLGVVFEFAKENGCSEVDLLDKEGKPAAHASPDKSEIIMH